MSSIRKIVQGNDNYFLQIKIVSEVSVINLTDLKNLWQTRITESEAVQKFKDDNPLIHSSDKWIAEYVSTMMTNVNNNIKVTVGEPHVNIYFCSDVSNLPTKLNLLLHLQPQDMVYKEITLPLMMVINELKFREEKLLSLLKAKDVEIKEYKFEGANITRRNAITVPFNAESFDTECQSSLSKRAKEVINNPYSVLCPTLNSLYCEFSSVVAEINIKQEKVESNSTDSKE
uniref:Non-homologous end-joining factor 1 n=3 Tax=Rhodnius prolixus TaxID=13249 RepID=T1HZU0_RHOPR